MPEYSEARQIEEILGSMAAMNSVAPFVRAMIYGNPGCGKTVLGFRLAHELLNPGEKILYVDTAQGFTTLAANTRWQHLLQDSFRLPFEGVSQLNALAAGIGKDPRFAPVKVVIIDEANTAAERDTVTVARYRTMDTGRTDPNEITWPDRNISYNRMKEAFTALQAHDIHIIYLAHARNVKDTQTRIMKLAPAFGPQQIDPILAPLQFVGYAHSYVDDDKKRGLRIQCREMPTITAKTQFDQLGTYASFDEVIAAVAGFSRGKVSDTKEVIETFSKNDLTIQGLDSGSDDNFGAISA